MNHHNEVAVKRSRNSAQEYLPERADGG